MLKRRNIQDETRLPIGSQNPSQVRNQLNQGVHLKRRRLVHLGKSPVAQKDDWQRSFIGLQA
jgi:hypothetical protein